MGAVYRAEQLRPVKREVALKLIKTGMDSRAVLARFDAERQALALMDHPNIARVYDGGATEANQPFFVMELVKGVPITEYCDQHRLPVQARLELFVSVCQAVQHAHQKGIIHRDLKPGNLLVTEVDGRPTPKVIDFGVAKATEFDLTDQSPADTGANVGTPTYMSPEQADPSSMDIDTRTDVYTLGAVLYELLTGSPLLDARRFKRGALAEMLRMVREVDPPRPSAKVGTAKALPGIAASRNIDPTHLKRELRGDLDWIVKKALQKDRTRRYETVNGFAADVRRHLANEPVAAAPPSRAYRMRKFVQRHRGGVIAASLVLLTLLAGIAGTTWGLIEARRQEHEARRQEKNARDETSEKEKARRAEVERAEGERLAKQVALAAAHAEKTAKEMAQISFAEARKAEKEATEQRSRADHEAELARQNLYYAQMHLAQQAWREHRGLPHMRELIANWLPKGESPDRRGWEWFYLNSLPYQNLRTFVGSENPGACTTVAWHFASNRLAEGTADGLIRIWDVDREQTTLTLSGPAPAITRFPQGVRWLGWNPDGGRLAAGCGDGTVHVWETGSGRELHVLRGHTSPVYSVAYSSDGMRLATWGVNGTIKIWDADTGRLDADIVHPDHVSAGAWSPDNTLLASGHADGTLTISGTHAGGKIVTLRGHVASIDDLAWSFDGTRLASASYDFTARIWEVASEKMVLGPLRHSHRIMSVAWEPNGQRLATGGADLTVKIWNATTGHEDLSLRGHQDRITSLVWSPDGRLASGALDGRKRIWDSIRDQESNVLPGHVVRATAVAWGPDGRRLASAGDDGKIRIWDPATGQEALTLKGHDESRVDQQFGLIRSLAWSPDGAHLASAGLDGTAKVWQVAGGREVFALPADHGAVWSLAWSPDGTHLAAGSQDGTIRVVKWLEPDPSIHVIRAHPGDVRSLTLAWSPLGDRLASGGYRDQLIKVWDPARGAELARMRGEHGWILALSFSPDGTRLASASERELWSASIHVWNAVTGRELSSMRGHNDRVDAVVWSPDGTRLASAGLDNSVRVWDPRTGQETLKLRGNAGFFHDVSWNPDGAQLAAASSDGQIWIWDATRGFERDMTPRGLPYTERAVASGTARGEDIVSYAESYIRAGKFEEALFLAKDDPYGLCKLGPLLDEQGRPPLADEARNRARTLWEQQLAAKSYLPAPPSELVDLLLSDSRVKWSVLTPVDMKAESGARLELQKDGSVFVHPKQPFDNEVYSLLIHPELKAIASLRLEVLADSRLPHGGPGWGENGNFLLNELTLQAAPAETPDKVRSIAIRNARADFSSGRTTSGYWDVRGAVDGSSSTGWAVYPEFNKYHAAVFDLAEDLGEDQASRLTVRLIHKRVKQDRNLGNLGRFRLSASSHADTFHHYKTRLADMKLIDPWARLALAYHFIGNQPALNTLLIHHPAAAVGIGDLFAAEKDWERAIDAYRKVITDRPADVNVLTKLATAYEAAGRTREAVPHLSTLSSVKPADTLLSLKVAALQAWFGQDQELAATRQRVLAFAKGTNDAITARRAVRSFGVRPSTDKAELEAALVLGRTAVNVDKDVEWNLLALGIMEFRNGNAAAADEALLATTEASKSNPLVAGISGLYRAMSLFRLGKRDEARALALAAAAKMKLQPDDEKNPLAGGASADDLIFWLAYKEAKAMIQFDAAPAAPATRNGK
jgi:WD40 repeat protein/tetratricopeptide (TPR) repeat protein